MLSAWQNSHRRPGSSRRTIPYAESTRWLFVLGMVLWLLAGERLPAGEPLRKYFDGLRTRQLYSLAERYCLERLGEEDLTPGQRIEFAAELGRTLMEHATTLPVAEQPELWERTQQVLTEARQRVGTHGRHWILDLQLALLPCAQGESAVWQVELNPDDFAVRQSGLKQLQQGIAGLETLDVALRTELRKPIPKDFSGNDSLWPVEVRQLLWTTQLELARALSFQARVLTSTPADRLEVWAKVDKTVASLLGNQPPDDMRRSGLLLAAAAARERGDLARAQRLLETLGKETLPTAVSDQVLAEQVRLLRAKSDDLAGAELLRQKLAQRTPIPGELTVLQIESLLQLWDAAEQRQAKTLARDLWQTAVAMQKRLEDESNSYWAGRGRALLDRAQDAGKYGEEIAALLRNARSLYAQRKLADSAREYGQVVELATQQSHPGIAAEAGLTRGSLLIELKDFPAAVSALQGASRIAPDATQAAQADLLAAYALGKHYETEATKANREAYTTALLEHRTRFAELPSAGEAAWMLGQLEERRLQYTLALKYYQQIAADHPRAEMAFIACARCYDQIVRRARELNQPTAPWVQSAMEQLSRVLPSDPQVPLNDAQTQVVLHLAHLVLQADEPRYVTADEWLARILNQPAIEQSPPEDPADAEQIADIERRKNWQRTALRLRIISLAGQGELATADRLLQQLTLSEPAELLTILDGLGRLVDQAQNAPQHQLGELQLRAALALQRKSDQLTPEQRQQLQNCLAEAFVAAGRYAEARSAYQPLLRLNPPQRRFQESYARLLLKFEDRASREEALGLWQQFAKLEPAGTEHWLEIRLEVARTLLLLQRNEEAKKLLNVTRILYPKLGTEQQRADLQALVQQANQ